MEWLISIAIGVMTATGVFLTLRARTFPVVLGLTLLAYAVNVFLFVMGRLNVGLPAVIDSAQTTYTDPLPQALVLTAIVIAFGMTAFLIVLALKARSERWVMIMLMVFIWQRMKSRLRKQCHRKNQSKLREVTNNGIGYFPACIVTSN